MPRFLVGRKAEQSAWPSPLTHTCSIPVPRSFTELAKLIEPGNEPKTDKNAILTDAIKYVQQVQVENHQLRQLNKFLEVRLAGLGEEMKISVKAWMGAQ